jgi:hypothetical protein
VVSEVEHLPLISDELFARAQQRFRENGRRTNGRSNGQAAFLFTGMVRCASGHPLRCTAASASNTPT